MNRAQRLKINGLCLNAIFAYMELYGGENFTINLRTMKGLTDEDFAEMEGELPLHGTGRGINFTISKEWELSFVTRGVTARTRVGGGNGIISIKSEMPVIFKKKKGISKINIEADNERKVTGLMNGEYYTLDMDPINLFNDVLCKGSSVVYAHRNPKSPSSNGKLVEGIEGLFIWSIKASDVRAFIMDKGRFMPRIIFNKGLTDTLTPAEEKAIYGRCDETSKGILKDLSADVWGNSPDEHWGALKDAKSQEIKKDILGFMEMYKTDEAHVSEYMNQIIQNCQGIMNSITSEKMQAVLGRTGYGAPRNITELKFEFVDYGHRALSNAVSRWTKGTQAKFDEHARFSLTPPCPITDSNMLTAVVNLFMAEMSMSETPYDVRVVI